MAGRHRPVGPSEPGRGGLRRWLAVGTSAGLVLATLSIASPSSQSQAASASQPGLGADFECGTSASLYLTSAAGSIESVPANAAGSDATVTPTVASTAAGDPNLAALGVSANGSFAYAYDASTRLVYVYSPLTKTWAHYGPFRTGSKPIVSGAVDPASGNYYFAAAANDPIYVFDAQTHALRSSVTVAPSKLAGGDFAFDASGDLYLVSAHTLAVLTAAQLASTAQVTPAVITSSLPVTATGAAFDGAGNLYLTHGSAVTKVVAASGKVLGRATTINGAVGSGLASCTQGPTLSARTKIVTRHADSDRFAVAITGGGLDRVTAGPVPASAGATYTYTETATKGSLKNYTITVSCIDPVTGVSVLKDKSISGATFSATVPASGTAGQAVTCTFTNTAKKTVAATPGKATTTPGKKATAATPAARDATTPTVTIAKTTSGGTGSNTFGFTLTGVTTTTDTITVSGANTATSATAHTGTTGTAATIKESSVPAAWPANPASASCLDSAAPGDGNPTTPFGALSAATVTIAAANMVAGAAITCTFVDNAPPQVIIAKTTTGGVGANTFGYTLTGVTNTTDSVSVTGTGSTTSTATHLGTAGTAATITESSVPTSWPANPAAASCVDSAAPGDGNPTTAFGTLSTNKLSLAAANMVANAVITLHFGNVRGAAPVTVHETDDLSDVLDDATITTAPRLATGSGLTVGHVSGAAFAITGTLAAGASATVTYQVTVNSPDTGNNGLINFLVPTGVTPSGTCGLVMHALTDDASGVSPTCTANPVSDLKVSKTVDPTSGKSVKPGQKLTYTLHFDNSAGQAAATVDETDSLADVLDDATMVSGPKLASGSGLVVSSVSNDSVQITGTLAAGAKATVRYTVQVRSGGLQGTLLINYLHGTGTSTPVSCPPRGSSMCTSNPISGDLAFTGPEVNIRYGVSGGIAFLLLGALFLLGAGRRRRRES